MDKKKENPITFDDVLIPYLTDDENILKTENDIAKDILLFNDTGIELEVTSERIGETERLYFKPKEGENNNTSNESIDESDINTNNENIEDKDYEKKVLLEEDNNEKEEVKFSDLDEPINTNKEQFKEIKKYSSEDTKKTFNDFKEQMGRIEQAKQENDNNYNDQKSAKSLTSFATVCLVLGLLLLTNIKGFSNFVGLGKICIFVIWLAVIMNLSVIIHEFGHLVFGLLSGYKFASFRVGKNILVKNNGKLTLKKYRIQGTGGQCLMMPPEAKGDNCDFPYRIYNFGGVIMNVLVAVICLIIYLLVPYTMGVSEGLLVCILINGYSALVNGVPRTFDGIANDGANGLYLSNDLNMKKAFYAQLRINGLQTRGVRLKDMDPNLFELDESVTDLKNPLISAMKSIKCAYLIDKHDFDGAREYIESSIEKIGDGFSIHKLEMQCELLFLELIGECRKEEIEKIYNDDLKRYINNTKRYYVSRRRLLYTYELLYNTDEDAAKEELESFEIIGRYYPYETEVDGEIELIHIVHDIYENEYEEYDEDEEDEQNIDNELIKLDNNSFISEIKEDNINNENKEEEE